MSNLIKTDTNSTTASSFNGLVPLTVSVDMVSTALLVSGIRLMHQGIEIGHPVYAILFNNLLVTLIACLVEIVLLLMPTATRPESMIKACSIFSGLFHIYSWLLVSMPLYWGLTPHEKPTTIVLSYLLG